MARKDAGQTKEAIHDALTKTGLSRAEIAERLGVQKQSVDRWASTGRISTGCWNDLVRLLDDVPAGRKPLEDCSLEEITAELERRRWKVTLERMPCG